MPTKKRFHEITCKCGRTFVATDSRRKRCEYCRKADIHRHSARRAKTPTMFVCVDCEWRTVNTDDGPRAVLMTLSFGREDGTSETTISGSSPDKLRWLLRRLAKRHIDADGVEWRQAVIAFHFTGDSSILVRDFDPEDMFLIRKVQSTLKTVLCGSDHAPEDCPLTPGRDELRESLAEEAEELGVWMEERPAAILHRYNADDVQAVITEGGEGDVIAFDRSSKLAVAVSPRRRMYIEYRPNGDRFEGWERVDIHDIGSAIPGSLEKALDDWNPDLSDSERKLIAWGKEFRQGWPDEVDIEQVAAYSEAECVATARIARKLIIMIATAAHVPMQETELFGSGSVAGAVMKHYGVPTRKESQRSDELVDDIEIDTLAKLTYFGGLIETPMVGLITGQTDEDDLAAAYPHKLVAVPCMRQGHGHWVVQKKGGPTIPEEKIGHVLVSWALPDHKVISTGPFTVRRKNCTVVQPRGCSHVWVTLAEYRAAVEHFGSEIICHKLVYWKPDCDCPPPFAFIQELYDRRNAIKAQMKTLVRYSEEWWHLNCLQNTLKLIMNSIYGKSAQVRPVLGKYTNLHIASYITGATRAQVRTESWAREAQGGHVSYQHTDSVLSIGGIPSDGGTTLGAWKLEDPSQDFLILQPGLATALGGGKTATRGCGKHAFMEAATAYAATTDFTRHPTEWPILEIHQTTMITRRVALATNRPKMAGAFVPETTKISPVSPKRDIYAATQVPGIPTAWQVPLIEFEYEPAELSDIRAYRTQLEKRSRAGEFDNDLH